MQRRQSKGSGFLYLLVLLLCLLGMQSFSTEEAAAQASEPALDSPVFADYNTFYGITNILELIASGNTAVVATIRIYRIDGTQLTVLNNVVIQPGQQRDIIINDLINNAVDTYGVIQIEYDSINSELEGRMSYYRLNSDGETYSFAFSRQLAEASTGNSYAVANSIDPQNQGFLVPNWLQVTNVSPIAQTYTIRLYDAAGTFIRETVTTLQTFERQDFSGGHELGQGVYLTEVIPSDPSAEYISALSRYGWNTVPGAEPQDFAFAISLATRPGAPTDQITVISNREGQCSIQSSWVEVANVTSSPVDATVTMYDRDGAQLQNTMVTLAAKSQMHLNGNLLLEAGSFGSARIVSSVPNALLSEGSVYYQNCRSLNVETAYSVPAISSARDAQFGSFNRFLGMQNDMIVISATNSTVMPTITVRSDGIQLFSGGFTFGGFETNTLDLNDNAMFHTQANTYGTVLLDAGVGNIGQFAAYMLRTRFNADGSIDFVNPTVFR